MDTTQHQGPVTITSFTRDQLFSEYVDRNGYRDGVSVERLAHDSLLFVGFEVGTVPQIATGRLARLTVTDAGEWRARSFDAFGGPAVNVGVSSDDEIARLIAWVSEAGS